MTRGPRVEHHGPTAARSASAAAVVVFPTPPDAPDRFGAALAYLILLAVVGEGLVAAALALRAAVGP